MGLKISTGAKPPGTGAPASSKYDDFVGVVPVKSKPIIGTVTTKAGDAPEQEKEHVIHPGVMSPKAMANVGVNLYRTINLGNFNSFRVGVSLNVPCQNTPEGIEEAYEFALKWADDKMKENTQEFVSGS